MKINLITKTHKVFLLSNNKAPFSYNLNTAILKTFDKLFLQSDIVVEFVNSEPYSGYNELIKDIATNRRLQVSKLHSDITIFGDPSINWMFRAIHDYLHYKLCLSFSYEHELLVNYHQNIMFRNMGLSQFGLDLLNIETAGQIVYHREHAEFPENQREFTINELIKMGY